jgi:hypothetical protein
MAAHERDGVDTRKWSFRALASEPTDAAAGSASSSGAWFSGLVIAGMASIVAGGFTTAVLLGGYGHTAADSVTNPTASVAGAAFGPPPPPPPLLAGQPIQSVPSELRVVADGPCINVLWRLAEPVVASGSDPGHVALNFSGTGVSFDPPRLAWTEADWEVGQWDVVCPMPDVATDLSVSVEVESNLAIYNVYEPLFNVELKAPPAAPPPSAPCDVFTCVDHASMADANAACAAHMAPTYQLNVIGQTECTQASADAALGPTFLGGAARMSLTECRAAVSATYSVEPPGPWWIGAGTALLPGCVEYCGYNMLYLVNFCPVGMGHSGATGDGSYACDITDREKANATLGLPPDDIFGVCLHTAGYAPTTPNGTVTFGAWDSSAATAWGASGTVQEFVAPYCTSMLCYCNVYENVTIPHAGSPCFARNDSTHGAQACTCAAPPSVPPPPAPPSPPPAPPPSPPRSCDVDLATSDYSGALVTLEECEDMMQQHVSGPDPWATSWYDPVVSDLASPWGYATGLCSEGDSHSRSWALWAPVLASTACGTDATRAPRCWCGGKIVGAHAPPTAPPWAPGLAPVSPPPAPPVTFCNTCSGAACYAVPCTGVGGQCATPLSLNDCRSLYLTVATHNDWEGVKTASHPQGCLRDNLGRWSWADPSVVGTATSCASVAGECVCAVA